jgi:hypothetical protein
MAVLNYIPNGPANLQSIFPSVDFTELAEYFIELMATDGTTMVARSTVNVLHKRCSDTVRIHFVNGCGTMDAIDFDIQQLQHQVKSEEFETPGTHPHDYTRHGIQRFNIKANDVYEGVNILYGEEQQEWLDELFDSPMAWIEQSSPFTNERFYLPIVILDNERQKIKPNGRYLYEVKIQFKLSNEVTTIRN